MILASSLMLSLIGKKSWPCTRADTQMSKDRTLKILFFFSVQVNYVSAHDNETLFDIVMLKVCFLEPCLLFVYLLEIRL